MDKKDIYQTKIQNIESLFDNLETKIDGIKAKIKFDEQIKRYLVIQNKLKILSKSEEDIKSIEKQFISLESLDQKELKLFNQIKISESKISPLKKQSEDLIILIDQKNKELIPLIKNEKLENERNEVEKSKLSEVKKEISKANKDLKILTNDHLKINDEIAKLRKDKAKFIEKQFISLEKQNQIQLKLFKQVQFTESKISSLKKQLENLIILIDQNNEELVPIITSKEHKKTNLKSLIDKREISNKEKHLKSLNNELLKINDKILKQKKEKHSIIVLSYFKNQILKEIKETKNFINQANNANPEKIKLQLSVLQEQIDIKNSLVEKQIVNLAFAQKLMQKVDSTISSWNKENIYCKENIDIQYLNKNIARIEDLFDKLQIEIILKKEEIKFEKTLKEYSKTKYELKKLNKRKIVDSEVKQNIIKFQKLKQSQLKLLKPIEAVEIKIFQLKKQLENIIFSIDRKKNQYEYFTANIEVQKKELELSIDEQKFLEQTKQLKVLDKELFKINVKLLKLKSEKKPIMAFVYLRNQKIKEIKEIILYLRKSHQVDLHKVQLKIARFQKLINLRSPLIKGEINNLELAQKLITKMDASISFGSEEDIDPNLAFSIKYLNIYYGYKHALYDVNIDIPKKGVTAIIGPSGCGKSTFIRTLNRINDQIPGFRVKGIILFDGEYNIYKLRSVINRYNKIDISTLRTKVGMIFQQPNPFPMSIYKNVTYGPKVRGIKNKAILNDVVVKALKDAGLYEEVKDNLKVLGSSLSGGQQQRLCIARAIANEPEVLLMDEPTSALDPIAAAKVEELIHELKKDYTIIVVTHSMQQAKRLSDRTAFFYEGRLIEYRDTKDLFENPKEKETKEYISGKFG